MKYYQHARYSKPVVIKRSLNIALKQGSDGPSETATGTPTQTQTGQGTQ